MCYHLNKRKGEDAMEDRKQFWIWGIAIVFLGMMAIGIALSHDEPNPPATSPTLVVPQQEVGNPVFTEVEEMAQFPGGDEACYKWLSEHLNCSAVCQEQGEQRRVVVSFVVDTDGSIVDVKAVRSPNPDLAREAERVVREMPKWKPGRQDGRIIRCRMMLPILFQQPRVEGKTNNGC